MAVAQSLSQPNGAANGRPPKRFWAQALRFLCNALSVVAAVVGVVVAVSLFMLVFFAWMKGFFVLTEKYLPSLLPERQSHRSKPAAECVNVGGLRGALPVDVPAETRLHLAQQQLSEYWLAGRPVCEGAAANITDYMKELQLEAANEGEQLSSQACRNAASTKNRRGWRFWLRNAAYIVLPLGAFVALARCIKTLGQQNAAAQQAAPQQAAPPRAAPQVQPNLVDFVDLEEERVVKRRTRRDGP